MLISELISECVSGREMCIFGKPFVVWKKNGVYFILESNIAMHLLSGG